jgi:hypothetical protein
MLNICGAACVVASITPAAKAAVRYTGIAQRKLEDTRVSRKLIAVATANKVLPIPKSE